MGSVTGVTLPKHERRQDAQRGACQREADGKRGGTLAHVPEDRQFHDQQEPRRHHPGDLGDEILYPHETRALVVVGGELVAEGDPRRGEDGVGEVEDERADEEVVEIERFATTLGELPQQRQDQRRQDRADEDVGPATSPPRPRAV